MLKLGLIFGGRSSEHEVSLASARGVLDALNRSRYVVTQFGIDRAGRWYAGEGAWTVLYGQAERSRLPASLRDMKTEWMSDGDCISYEYPPVAELASVDCLFPVTHGEFGEDGSIQGLCAMLDKPLVGCGVSASAVCYDKWLTKSVLASAGLPVLAGIVVDRSTSLNLVSRWVDDNIEADRDLFFKPVRGGSSLGISRVSTLKDVPQAIETALQLDDRVLIEPAIDHDELVIGVIGDSKAPLISPPGLCVSYSRLYSYEEKYMVGNTGFRCPAPIHPDAVSESRELARAAYSALGCTGFARIDIFVERETSRLVINEVNTIPGLTASSVFPKVMNAAGVPFQSLLDLLIETAVPGLQPVPLDRSGLLQQATAQPSSIANS